MSEPLSQSAARSESVRDPRADVVRVFDAIRSIIQSLRISGRAVEQEVGISSAQLNILQELAQRPAQSINDLAYNTFTHQSSVSMVVSRLVDKELVRRMPSRGDARRVSISLTPSGRALVRRSPYSAETQLLDGLRAFSRNDLRALGKYLDTLACSLGAEVDESRSSEGTSRA